MATALATQDRAELQAAPDALYTSLALKGDISGLSNTEKVTYYRMLCERLGLDPTTQPFQPLKLSGKEVLYASKGAADQLARIHNVQRSIVGRETVSDVHVVTVRATLPNGRVEEEIGAVPLGNLKGESLANALMKAVTKAKRRATLAILGLGMLDETEIETIPARAVESAGWEPITVEAPKPPQPASASNVATDEQLQEIQFLSNHAAIDQRQRDRIRANLGRGYDAEQAALELKWLERRIAVEEERQEREAMQTLEAAEPREALEVA